MSHAPSSFAALVADAKALWDTTVMSAGDAPKTREFVAPDGTWTMRLYVGQRGYKKCLVTSPFLEGRGDKVKLYSVRALVALLHETYGVVCDGVEPTPATPDVLTDDSFATQADAPADSSSPLEDWASLVLQKHYREYRLWRTRQQLTEMQAKLHDLKAKEYKQGIVAYATRLHEEQAREGIEATLLPLVLPHNLNSARMAPLRPVEDLTVRLFSLTRDALHTVASTYLTEHAPRTHEYDSALTIRSDTHYPLLLGPLPLPTGTRAIRLGRGTVYVRNTDGTLSADHLHALKTHFSPPWKTQVKKMCMERQSDCLAVFDVFGDRACTNEYIGSLVLAKFACRRHGIVAPALSIESIVAKVKHAGHGPLMYDLCTHMLFADTSEATASHGYLFAQCLDFDFWGRMDPNRYGKAFVFQLVQVYKTYHFEDECTLRSIRFDREDVFGFSASPDH